MSHAPKIIMIQQMDRDIATTIPVSFKSLFTMNRKVCTFKIGSTLNLSTSKLK